MLLSQMTNVHWRLDSIQTGGFLALLETEVSARQLRLMSDKFCMSTYDIPAPLANPCASAGRPRPLARELESGLHSGQFPMVRLQLIVADICSFAIVCTWF